MFTVKNDNTIYTGQLENFTQKVKSRLFDLILLYYGTFKSKDSLSLLTFST